MTGLLNLFGLCTMEQLHRNMEEVVGVKHELAHREAEIGELRREVARTQITTQMRDLEFRLAGIRSRLRELNAEELEVRGRYREKIRPLRSELQALSDERE